MCNRYETPEEREIERVWRVGRDQPGRWWDEVVFPRGRGVFIRRAVNDAAYSRELVAGQWGLIPWFAKAAKLSYSTNNARSEELAAKATYKQPWAKGQRCIIPAQSYVEPYWGTGKHIPWKFSRADGDPWGLAGLWSEWTDPSTGEVLPNFTMITQNCDETPVLNLMHRPDPKRAPHMQDKRTVVPLEKECWDAWLHGSVEQAQSLIRVPPVEVFVHGPVDPAVQLDLSAQRGLV